MKMGATSVMTRMKEWVRERPALERVARRLFDVRYQLARQHLRGVGVEIGALDRPLMLPRGATAFYLDRLLPSALYRHYPELSHRRFFVSVVGDGETMTCIRDGSLDFIIANHVIEHCQDPIGTLKTFVSKLKTSGIVFLAVPDMRLTFDQDRVETGFEHLRRDHEEGPEISRPSHYLEWATQVEHLDGAAARARMQALLEQDYSIHFHCWTRDGFLSFLERLRGMLPITLRAVRNWRNENVFILEKREMVWEGVA